MGGVRATSGRNENVLAFAVAGGRVAAIRLRFGVAARIVSAPERPLSHNGTGTCQCTAPLPTCCCESSFATAQLKTLMVCEFSPLNAIV
jgi:hypothetical protein